MRSNESRNVHKKSNFFFYNFTILLFSISFLHASFVKERLKNEFLDTFKHACSNFPLVVDWHQNKLRSPGNKYVVFVFQKDSFSSKGLGDRFIGLIHAATIALRFNRTLLIKSENGLDKIFQPYYSPYHSLSASVSPDDPSVVLRRRRSWRYLLFV